MKLCDELKEKATRVEGNIKMLQEKVLQANNMFLLQINAKACVVQEENVRLIVKAQSLEDAQKLVATFNSNLAGKDVNSCYIPQGLLNNLNKCLPDIKPILSSCQVPIFCTQIL